jgi:uncharacterized membrane protein
VPESPDGPEVSDLERERRHTREVQRILYGKTQLVQEVLPRFAAGAAAASLAAGLAGLLSSSGIHLTARAITIALAITAGTVLLVLTMVLAIRLVQRRRSHLQPVRIALKEAYVKAIYILYAQAKVEPSSHAR